MSAKQQLAEAIEFLASSPKPAEIMAFNLSAAGQACLEELLHKQRQDELTTAEAGELDTYQQLNHIFILLKARAYGALRRCVECGRGRLRPVGKPGRTMPYRGIKALGIPADFEIPTCDY